MATKRETKLVRDIRVSLRGKVGGLWIKTHGSVYAQQGLPDLIGCVEGVFFGLEVKMPGEENEVTPLQNETLMDIIENGGFASVVTDEDEAIQFVLSGLGLAEIPQG